MTLHLLWSCYLVNLEEREFTLKILHFLYKGLIVFLVEYEVVYRVKDFVQNCTGRKKKRV